jgi:hypothetical protein
MFQLQKAQKGTVIPILIHVWSLISSRNATEISHADNAATLTLKTTANTRMGESVALLTFYKRTSIA